MFQKDSGPSSLNLNFSTIFQVGNKPHKLFRETVPTGFYNNVLMVCLPWASCNASNDKGWQRFCHRIKYRNRSYQQQSRAAGGAAKLKDLTQQQILFTKISGLHPLISKHSIIITALSLLLTDSSASCFPSSQCSTNLKWISKLWSFRVLFTPFRIWVKTFYTEIFIIK